MSNSPMPRLWRSGERRVLLQPLRLKKPMSPHNNLKDDGWRVIEDTDGFLLIQQFYVDGMGRYVMRSASGLSARSGAELRSKIIEIEKAPNRPHMKWQEGYGWVEIDQ